MLAGLSMAALAKGRQWAREEATRATITKLDAIIMERYESYVTRRVPIDTTGMSPVQAASARLAAIRQLMRLEMPDNLTDTFSDAKDESKLTALSGTIQSALAVFNTNPPALWTAYNNYIPGSVASVDAPGAVCLYMFVSISSPEAMEQFNQSEIGTVDGKDGAGAVVAKFPVFVDGWGTPILWLRWAPGYSAYSGIQSGIAATDHDPFDTRNLESTTAYRLIPLIYSCGADKKPGILSGGYMDASGTLGYIYTGDPYAKVYDSGSGGTGAQMLRGDKTNTNLYDNITNHQVETR